jgi:hypothetical protein
MFPIPLSFEKHQNLSKQPTAANKKAPQISMAVIIPDILNILLVLSTHPRSTHYARRKYIL